MSSGEAPSYAVLWRIGDGPVCAGRLEVRDRVVALTGRSRGGAGTGLTVDRGQIAGLRIGRAASERIAGRPSLVLERRGEGLLLIADAIGVGGIRELADRLSIPPVTAVAQ